jgi:hypothetical protein
MHQQEYCEFVKQNTKNILKNIKLAICLVSESLQFESVWWAKARNLSGERKLVI